MLGRHRVPGEDVEELVRQIEMAAARDLMAIDQHDIEFRQAAGRAGNALERIDHEHQYAQARAP